MKGRTVGRTVIIIVVSLIAAIVILCVLCCVFGYIGSQTGKDDYVEETAGVEPLLDVESIAGKNEEEVKDILGEPEGRRVYYDAIDLKKDIIVYDYYHDYLPKVSVGFDFQTKLAAKMYVRFPEPDLPTEEETALALLNIKPGENKIVLKDVDCARIVSCPEGNVNGYRLVYQFGKNLERSDKILDVVVFY